MSVVITPPISQPSAPASPTVMPPLYRLSVAQYHAMGEHGIFKPEDRVELIRGLLVTKTMKKSPHIIATARLRKVLGVRVPPGWDYLIQDPITLADSEPEPDTSVIRGQVDDYRSGPPKAADVGLVVEAAETSLPYDRGVKKELYGEAGIPTYWIVNLVDNQLEVYTDPTGPCAKPGYASSTTLGPADEVPLILDSQEVARIRVSDLLP